jgi:hypothetical protein
MNRHSKTESLSALLFFFLWFHSWKQPTHNRAYFVALLLSKLRNKLTDWLTDWLTNQPASQPTNYPTDSMEHSPPWKATSRSVLQEIPLLLWNPKVQYQFHKRPPLVPVLSQMHPVHIFPRYFSEIHSNILSSTPRSSEWSLSFRFSNQNILRISRIPHACYMPRQSNFNFDNQNEIATLCRWVFLVS